MAVSPCGLIAFASEEFRKETTEELMTDLSKELMREWSKECEWVLHHKELLGSAAEIIQNMGQDLDQAQGQGLSMLPKFPGRFS